MSDALTIWTKWTGIAGIVSAVIALIALSFSAADIRQHLREADLRDWEETTVYTIILGAGPQGLRRILLALISKRAVIARPDGTFSFDTRTAVEMQDAQAATAFRVVGSKILAYVTQAPGKYSSDDLERMLKADQIAVTDDLFDQILASAILYRIVERDSKGNFVAGGAPHQ